MSVNHAESVTTAVLPAPIEGTAIAHDDAVVLTRADWDVIAEAVRAARIADILPAEQENHLMRMSFVETEMVQAETEGR